MLGIQNYFHKYKVNRDNPKLIYIQISTNSYLHDFERSRSLFKMLYKLNKI